MHMAPATAMRMMALMMIFIFRCVVSIVVYTVFAMCIRLLFRMGRITRERREDKHDRQNDGQPKPYLNYVFHQMHETPLT